MTIVLDASSVLASVFSEPGDDRVRAALRAGAVMAALNFAEVAARYTMIGATRAKVIALRDDLATSVTFVPVDVELALEAGLVLPLTKPFGISLADRICMMLAKRLGLPALTADRDWLKVADALGVRVELIR